ncbi:MAG: hypothetical protein KGL63_14870 [Betaproteobacteria bacterium]|nr:hypothetical protein [Betaproteobacteria bacterium]
MADPIPPKKTGKREFFGSFLIFVTLVGCVSAIPALKGLQHVFDTAFDGALFVAAAAFGIDYGGDLIIRAMALKGGKNAPDQSGNG